MKKYIKILFTLLFVAFVTSCENDNNEEPIIENKSTFGKEREEIYWTHQFGTFCLLPGNGCEISLTISWYQVPYENIPSDVTLRTEDYLSMIEEGYQLAFIEADKWEKETFEFPYNLIIEKGNSNRNLEIPIQNLMFSKEVGAFVGFVKID